MESNFQSVKGKKKGTFHNFENSEGLREKKSEDRRSKVPFHVPSIPRPQEEYNIRVNNLNMRFEHVWLEKSEDGSRFLHPIEQLSVLDLVDGHVRESGPLNMHLESTPFKLVAGVKELKELATKLKDVNEFVVDLEHNQYRSFQGLTCLMQISTRTEDFVIDTLKLRVHVGPYLREVFKDPSKRKVMHGADCDILWLQRDFGIYVCNLFDTGQASRVLQLERNSLGYLLHHFCGIDINKEYQNADRRVRPFPDVMLKYAREDTHYLLHLYDLMKNRLLSVPSFDGNRETLLMEVYKRSNEICMHLYEKELLTNESFIHIYGLQEANFNSQQLSIVSGLYEWRDHMARTEDESTGYVLPNKALLEIARKMPLSSSKLRHLVKSKSPYVDHNHQAIIKIIRDSIQNASAFEKHAEALKNYLQEKYEQQNDAVGSVPLFRVQEREGSQLLPLPEIGCFFKPPDAPEKNNEKMGNGRIRVPRSAKPDIASSVKIQKKPTSELEETLRNPPSKNKFDHNVRSAREQDKADIKIQQYKSSTTLPIHSFSGARRFLEPKAIEEQETASSRNEIEKSRCSTQTPIPDSSTKLREQLPSQTEGKKSDTLRDPLSLTNTSSCLEECFQVKQFNGLASRQPIKPEEPQEDRTVGAREILTSRVSGQACNCKGSFIGPSHGKERIGEIHQSWWQQAFPPPCNRGMGNL